MVIFPCPSQQSFIERKQNGEAENCQAMEDLERECGEKKSELKLYLNCISYFICMLRLFGKAVNSELWLNRLNMLIIILGTKKRTIILKVTSNHPLKVVPKHSI